MPGKPNASNNSQSKVLACCCADQPIWDSTGVLRLGFLRAATNQLLQLLGPSAPVAGIDANGHGPDAPEDNWRKPSPAMPLEPAQDLNLDFKRSILVGDRCSDLDARARAGVQTLVHVLTGHRREERPLLTARGRHEWLRVLEPQPAELLLLNSLLDFPAALLSQNR